MLLGQTGCGKSSLINLIFGRALAMVNDISRGTEHFATYSGKDHSLGVNLIDSWGYEMENRGSESFDSYSKSIKNKITFGGNFYENKSVFKNHSCCIIGYDDNMFDIM